MIFSEIYRVQGAYTARVYFRMKFSKKMAKHTHIYMVDVFGKVKAYELRNEYIFFCWTPNRGIFYHKKKKKKKNQYSKIATLLYRCTEKNFSTELETWFV